MNPEGSATLHTRGGEKLIDRLLASGTMRDLVKRVMLEAPDKRRELIIIYDGMEFQSAEIQNLAGQVIFNEGYRSPAKSLGRNRRRPAL